MKEEAAILKEYWLKQKQSIINPDDITWEDLGFTEPEDRYKSIEDYLEDTGDEFDKRSQVSLQLIDEFLESIDTILGKC